MYIYTYRLRWIIQSWLDSARTMEQVLRFEEIRIISPHETSQQFSCGIRPRGECKSRRGCRPNKLSCCTVLLDTLTPTPSIALSVVSSSEFYPSNCYDYTNRSLGLCQQLRMSVSFEKLELPLSGQPYTGV